MKDATLAWTLLINWDWGFSNCMSTSLCMLTGMRYISCSLGKVTDESAAKKRNNWQFWSDGQLRPNYDIPDSYLSSTFEEACMRECSCSLWMISFRYLHACATDLLVDEMLCTSLNANRLHSCDSLICGLAGKIRIATKAFPVSSSSLRVQFKTDLKWNRDRYSPEHA